VVHPITEFSLLLSKFLAEQARINVERLKDLAGEAGLVAVVRFPIEFSL